MTHLVEMERSLRKMAELLGIDFDTALRNAIEPFGGEGSGNFGHAGRPGEVGGSGEGDGSPKNKIEREKKISQRVFDSSSDDEKAAIRKYKGEDYEYINANLRNDGGALSEDEDYDYDGITAKIDAVISRSKLSEPIIVYRGMSNDVLDDDNSVGLVFSDAGFISTTADLKIANRFESGLIAKIHLDKGQSAFMADSIGGQTQEDEFILPRGTKFKVISDALKESGIREVDLEIVR